MDSDFPFDDDFDFDTGADNLLGDQQEGGTGSILRDMAAAGFAGDFDDDLENEDFLGDGESQVKRQRMEGGEASSGPHASARAAPSDAPLPIDNVTQYFPNVAPNAFPVIVNVLAQATIPEGPDLRALSCATRNVEFMPKSRNASATMRLQDPSAVVTIRSSGSMTIIGAASVSEARQATELAARIIRKALNLTFQTFSFRVRSIAARFNICSPVRLSELANFSLERFPVVGLSEVHCSYEPERFNGCVMKLVGASEENRWVVTCLIFVTGKVTFMGPRSMDELRFAFDAMAPILAQYLGPTEPRPSLLNP